MDPAPTNTSVKSVNTKARGKPEDRARIPNYPPGWTVIEYFTMQERCAALRGFYEDISFAPPTSI
eukprot:6342135-Amphidinium_carterae.2